MRVLGIESSCDDTAAAVVEDGRRILASRVLSSARLQQQYGGGVPEVAAREHVMAIVPAVQETLRAAAMSVSAVDAVAVTRGPGLSGALLVGVTFAKALAAALKKPLIGVNHLEAHLYANALVEPVELPALALLVSGGHTSLFWWQDHGHLTLLGETRDDAAGEAFDKGARVLGLGYPGGPEIERLAAAGIDTGHRLPVARLGADSLDFSFSGVKTAVQDLARRYPDDRAGIAAALQEAVVKALVLGVDRAWRRVSVKHVYLAGGVTANSHLRAEFVKWGGDRQATVHIPPREYCTDNAAMVAALGYWRLKQGERMAMDAGPQALFPLGSG